jgi:hypothetical protein
MERDGDVPKPSCRRCTRRTATPACATTASTAATRRSGSTRATRRCWTAAGVIVHSDFSRRLAEQWYGPGSADDWRTIPLLRGQVARRRRRRPPATPPAKRLGVAAATTSSAASACSADQAQQRLLDAFLASPLAADPRCRLVFVGANDAGPYGIELAQRSPAAAAAARIRITGFVTPATTRTGWPPATARCNCAPQTRGETSASVLDCLMHGLPAIVNAHGAAADLPPDTLCMLPDEFDDAALSAPWPPCTPTRPAAPRWRSKAAPSSRANTRRPRSARCTTTPSKHFARDSAGRAAAAAGRRA